MSIAAGSLRHRIDIEEYKSVQNQNTGAIEKSWSAYRKSIPASIEPLSVRDKIAADANQSFIEARIVVRFDSDIRPSMRIKHNGQYWRIHGVLPDKWSGREYMTMPVSRWQDNG